MKKTLNNFINILLLLTVLFIIISKNMIIKNNFLNTTNLFLTNVFPSLFLMLLLSSFLINLGFVDILANLFQKPFSKLFKISPYAAYIFFMSLLTGNPANAKVSIDLIKNKYITKNDAEKILCMTHFLNPIFIISMTYPIFKNLNIVIKIIISIYLANIFIGIILRNFKECKNIKYISFKQTIENINKNYKPVNKILSNVVYSSFKTLLIVYSTMIIFSTIYKIIITIVPINTFSKNIISGIFEVSIGLNSLKNININLFLKEIITIFYLSLGGLCIISQIKSILSEENISIKYFLLSKILHFLLSIIIFIIII